MSPNDADGMANSVDPDQTAPTAPLGVVWPGSALFAQTCLSENFGKIRYMTSAPIIFSFAPKNDTTLVPISDMTIALNRYI